MNLLLLYQYCNRLSSPQDVLFLVTLAANLTMQRCSRDGVFSRNGWKYVLLTPKLFSVNITIIVTIIFIVIEKNHLLFTKSFTSKFKAVGSTLPQLLLTAS